MPFLAVALLQVFVSLFRVAAKPVLKFRLLRLRNEPIEFGFALDHAAQFRLVLFVAHDERLHAKLHALEFEREEIAPNLKARPLFRGFEKHLARKKLFIDGGPLALRKKREKRRRVVRPRRLVLEHRGRAPDLDDLLRDGLVAPEELLFDHAGKFVDEDRVRKKELQDALAEVRDRDAGFGRVVFAPLPARKAVARAFVAAERSVARPLGTEASVVAGARRGRHRHRGRRRDETVLALNFVGRDAGDRGDFLDEGEPQHRSLRHLQREGLAFGHDLGAVLRIEKILAVKEQALGEVDEPQGPADFPLEGFGALGLDEAVGIVLGRKQNEGRLLHVRDDGKRRLEGAARGLAARRVAVKRKEDLIRNLEELLHVLGRDRRAERRDAFFKPRLRELDHVHVPFAHDGAALAVDEFASFKEPVEFASLVVDRRLGAVDVLGLLVLLEGARTEPDHVTFHVSDREHQSVAVGVVAAVALVDQKPALDEFGRGVALAPKFLERVPAFGGVAEMKFGGGLAADPATLQIVDRLFALFELARIVAGGVGHVFGEALLTGFALDVAGTAPLARHLHVVEARELFDGLGKFEALVAHEKADGVAGDAATEALEELLGRTDREGRRLFLVEGTARLIVLPRLLERHVTPHDVDDVGAVKELRYETLGDHGGKEETFSDGSLSVPRLRYAGYKKRPGPLLRSRSFSCCCFASRQRRKRLCVLGARESGSELRLDETGHRSHVGLTEHAGLHEGHDFAHRGHAACARFGDGFVDDAADFLFAHLSGEIGFEHIDFRLFLGREVFASAGTVLLNGVAALLDHLCDDLHHDRVVGFDSFIHFTLLDRGKEQTNRAQTRGFVRTHRRLHIFADSVLNHHHPS